MRKFIYLLVLLFTFFSAASVHSQSKKPKNVIIMIADGFGPASVTMARDYLQATSGEPLSIDEILVGTSRTRATDSRVTDSAAGATAFSCGIKTYNGAIAVTPNKAICPTLFEAAVLEGKSTGLVATSRITHATPAAFSSHVPSRGMEEEIAAQQLNQGLDVIFGGGSSFFIPKSEGGKRTDERNLFREFEGKGFVVAKNLASFREINKTPVLSLLAPDHLDYEIDRIPTEQPSLAEMTEKALSLLSDNPNGFFLMIEGSRIDHAAHGNDPVGHLHDIIAYNKTMDVVLSFAKEHGETLVVSTADHETGGMTLGRDGVYQWNPTALETVSFSAEKLVTLLDAGSSFDFILENSGLNELDEEAKAPLRELYEAKNWNHFVSAWLTLINKKALIGWTTGGHTAVDVNVYAYGTGSDHFIGNNDNTNIGTAIIELMNFDMDKVLEVVLQNMNE